MVRPTKTQTDLAAKTQALETAQPAKPKPGASAEDLEKRIERLEHILDASIVGDDGLALVGTGHTLDSSEAQDPLQRAVERSNRKRGGRKA